MGGRGRGGGFTAGRWRLLKTSHPTPNFAREDQPRTSVPRLSLRLNVNPPGRGPLHYPSPNLSPDHNPHRSRTTSHRRYFWQQHKRYAIEVVVRYIVVHARVYRPISHGNPFPFLPPFPGPPRTKKSCCMCAKSRKDLLMPVS